MRGLVPDSVGNCGTLDFKRDRQKVFKKPIAVWRYRLALFFEGFKRG